MRISRRHPGRCFKKVLKTVSQVLEEHRSSSAGSQDTLALDPAFRRFYLLVLSRKMNSRRNSREARTLCEALDMLVAGRLPQALDLLAQRLLAVETADSEKSWLVAQHLELVPMEDASVTSEMQIRVALKRQASSVKLRKSLSQQSSGGH